MDEVIAYIMTTEWAAYFIAVCLVCRIFVTIAPASWTEKMPDWAMVLINKLALESNKDVDNKGNPK